MIEAGIAIHSKAGQGQVTDRHYHRAKARLADLRRNVHVGSIVFTTLRRKGVLQSRHSILHNDKFLIF